MRVDITTADADAADELNSLFGWLQRDEELTATAEVSRSSQETGYLGALDVINVVLTQGVAIANFIMVYRNWRDSRQKPPALVFKIGGVTITADDDSPEHLAIVRAALERALPDAAES
ncbi:hypothetical protein [Dactylosporangium sp. NPDC051541]|uniref:effector-associated constant component EACC1 n=1 Tax=Dactylosporangium sp. NPDC051541 TaxID=3363977 RepID=UPI00378E9A86